MVEFTLTAVWKICKRVHGRGFRTRGKSVDSNISCVRDYINNIPSVLLDEYVKLVIEKCMKIHVLDKLYYSILLDSIPLCRLTHICYHYREETYNFSISDDDDDELHFQFRLDLTPVLYEKLPNCSNLKELIMSERPRGKMTLKQAFKTFQRFSHLTTLTFIPREEPVSFHWVIGPVA